MKIQYKLSFGVFCLNLFSFFICFSIRSPTTLTFSGSNYKKKLHSKIERGGWYECSFPAVLLVAVLGEYWVGMEGRENGGEKSSVDS